MKTVTIIGYGRFGKVLHKLIGGDFKIKVYSRKRPMDLVEAYKSDTIFYCVPISSFESVIRRHKKYFRDGQTLIDVLSVKTHPKKVLAKYLAGTKTEAILTHPMFGPDSSKDGFKGLKIVMDRFRARDKTYAFWKKYFASKGLKVIEMTADKHDRFAARSQGVTHFIGRILSELKFSQTPIDTRGAEKLAEVMDQTCHDTWQLFKDLQNYNPYTKKMRIDFGKAQDGIYNKLLPSRVDRENSVFGIQGGIGSFNEQAIMHYLKTKKIKRSKIKYLYTSERVLRKVHEGDIDYGLFAIHNSVGGIVDESVNAMARYKFKIVEEVGIPIQHFLMKRKDVSLKDISRIMAHPQVFRQCQETLKNKFNRFRLTSGKGDLIDTARAAKAVTQGRLPKKLAILGPKRLAEIYGLDIIAENLQDDKTNTTNFLLVTR